MVVNRSSFRFAVIVIAVFAAAAAGAYITGRASASSLGLFKPTEPVSVVEAASRSEAMMPPTVILSDNFEGPTTFIPANSTVNAWVIGTATNNGGTNGAYISNDGGVTNAYSITTLSTNHLYAPITVPAGESAIVLSFDWRAVGEFDATMSDWDYLRVSVSSTVPVAGTFPAVTEQLPVRYSGQDNYTRAYVNLPASIADGVTRYLTFTWRNDASVGNQTPAAIDNVLVTSEVPTPISGTKSIPGDYPSIGSAFAHLNAHGADTSSGSVIFNVAAGSNFIETPGALTASGSSASNRIIFQKSGTGANPLVTAEGSGNFGLPSTGSVAGTSDAVIALNGADFVTFNGIDVASSSVFAVSPFSNIEYGFLVRNNTVLANVLTVNGSQSNVVQNASISMDRRKTTTVGILQTAATSTGAGSAATSAATANSGNIYRNLSIQNVYSGIYLLGTSAFPDTGVEIGTTSPTTFNTIGAAAANDIGNGSVLTWGIRATNQSGVKIYNNEVRNVTVTSTVVSDGIFLEAFQGTNEVNNNIVYNIRNASTSATSGVSGIRASHNVTGTHSARIYNNFVHGITSGYTGAASSARQIKGIFISGTGGGTAQDYDIANNSVRIDGSGSPNISSTAFEISTTSGPIYRVRNNIFSNFTGAQTSPAAHYTWVSTSSTLIGPAGSVSNFNDLFISNTTQGFVGLGNTTNYATLLAWQTAYTQDANSISANPLFASATDLHINVGSPAIDAGTTIGPIVTDIDNQARPNGPAYDIGADEFYPAPGNFQFSSTTYSGNEGTFANVVINRVGGSSGVATVDVTFADVTATGGTPCLGFDYDNFGGTTTVNFADGQTTNTLFVPLCTDSISPEPPETFTVTLTNPTGGTGLGSPTTATVTITDVPPPFSGTYTVGSSGTYPSLTNPGGIFQAINLVGVAGPVTIEIVSDLTGETGTHALNEFAAPHTVTIKPVGVPRTISGTSSTAIIKLNGADRVTINGSIAGLLYEPEAEAELLGGDPSIRELTIQNSNASGAAIWIATNATSGSTDNTIKNLNIVGPGAFGGQGIIAGSGTTFGAAAETGRPNSFNTIRNVRAHSVLNAVFTIGDPTTLDANWLITENDFGSATLAQKLSFRGIAVQNAQNFSITENRVSGISSATGSTSTMSGILVGATLNGGNILRNEIKDIRQNNTVGWGSNGIFLNSSSSLAGVTVANNFISDIASQGYNDFNQGDNGYGIMVNSGGQYGIWNNTIVMNTNQVATDGHSSCINIEDTVAAGSLAIQNNILRNTQTVGNRYGIIDQRTTPAVYSALSNNLYHNPTGAFFGRLNAINHSTLAAWQTATGLDGGSIDADPVFVSATNFHIQGTSPAIDAGTTIPLVANDFDGDARPQGAAYDIGGDEFVPYTVGGTVSGLAGTGLVLQNNGGDNLPISANGPFTFPTALGNGSPYNVTVFTQPTGPAQTCTVTNGSGTISGANVTNVQVTCVTVQWPLSVLLAGTGTGSVSSSPSGISCPGTCSANFNDSTLVVLTATPNPGSYFAGWSGGGCSGTGTCSVTMTAATNVTATFNLQPSVQFAASSFIDDESQSATITVTRTGDLTIASSVDVTLTDNTATGGASCTSSIDYVNPGTVPLSFGIGVSTQSFNVTLCGDTLTESTESVDLALTNNVGATLGSPSTAVLNINDTASQWKNPALISMTLGSVASPYPSSITVTGAPTSIGAIRVTLYDVWHDFPDHIDILLVGPTGASYVLMADAGGPAPGIPVTGPQTLTFVDHPAPVVPDSTAPTTGKYLPTTWESPVLSFAPPAPAGPYPTPGNAPFSGRTVANSMFGQFGLTDGNGTWRLYIRDDAGTPFAPDTLMGEVIGGWGIELLPPTNTNVMVSGRVMTPEGAGLRNAVVSMTDSFGITRTVTTSSLGYYVFADVAVGDTYVVGVSSRRYRFTTRVVPVLDPITDLDFIGQE